MKENNNFIDNLLKNVTTISFDDIENGKKYIITKDSNTNEYVVSITTNKTISMNEETNNIFDSLEQTFDSIDDTKYWSDNNEYPDQKRLWSMTKTKDGTVNKSGSTKYPDNWNEIINKIENF